jgi:hypothetical protein
MGNGQASAAKQQEVDPCHKLACTIQICLQENNYNQERCKLSVQEYNDCVKKYMELKQQK